MDCSFVFVGLISHPRGGGNLDKIEFEILMLCKLSGLFYKNLHNFDENFKLKFTSICTRLIEF